MTDNRLLDKRTLKNPTSLNKDDQKSVWSSFHRQIWQLGGNTKEVVDILTSVNKTPTEWRQIEIFLAKLIGGLPTLNS